MISVTECELLLRRMGNVLSGPGDPDLPAAHRAACRAGGDALLFWRLFLAALDGPGGREATAAIVGEARLLIRRAERSVP